MFNIPKPKISIVLPTYNQAHFLYQALEGIFSQTYQYYELIVVDDGSTDCTAELIAKYREQHSFTRIQQKNQGLPRALNAAFLVAAGDYLTWTSSDNIMLPEMLEVLSSALDADSTVGLVYADRYIMDELGRDLGRFNLPEYDPDLLLHCNLVQCCFLYRRDCQHAVGLYDPEFHYGEDWEYWIRISQLFAMKHIPQALYRYRVHSTSMTSDIIRGTAQSMGYPNFAKRIRRRMPVRWWRGKLKWWFIRLTNPRHPIISERLSWQQVAASAAGIHP
jgi:glycosyltransferase involved in cell wall biosynthesis